MHLSRWRSGALVWVLPFLFAAVAVACGGAAHTAEPTTTRPPTPTTKTEDVHMNADDFHNLHTMTHVRGFYVTNVLGHLDATLAVARSPNGGQYPTGTLLQLVPQEAMVKHRHGYDPTTNDWEFFSLDVSAQGTKIVTRGGQAVMNRFGGSCASCHSAANPKFDLVCEHDHGCAPLPIGDDVIRAVQNADPRPVSH
ncbi:MAG: uncharacterized protein JWL83_694 [Actinomycetia bacterium]|nr:uncharacterized protein [Actinomycetes bacterium]